MKCNKVREILLSDYIDEEGGQEVRTAIDEHLKKCNTCGLFYSTLREKVVMPFKTLNPVKSSPRIWENVKEKVYGKRTMEAMDLKEKLKDLIVFRAPVVAIASIMLFVVLGIRYFQVHNYNLIKEYVEQQMVYLSHLQGEEENGNGEGFGTSVEKYFF